MHVKAIFYKALAALLVLPAIDPYRVLREIATTSAYPELTLIWVCSRAAADSVFPFIK